MALSSATNATYATGDGSTTVFAYTFRIFANTDLRVITRDNTTGTETVQVLTTHYTVSGVGAASGGNVTFVTAPASGHKIAIERIRPVTQTTDIRNQGDFYPETHENAFDHFVMLAQQLQESIDRCLKVAKSEDGTTGATVIGDPVGRANRYIRFDSTGNVALTADAAVETTKVWVREGSLTTSDNARFGVWRANVAESYTGLDAQLRTAASGGDVVVELVKNGTTTIGTVTIPAGDTYAEETGLTLSLSDGDWVAPAITQIGGVDPGISLTFRLLP